jgi:Pyrrolidone-carboxylate peptidase (N-terminal pyroglutamyl peptidase)
MKTVLITGFEPFGPYEENLSQLAATKLQTLGDWDVYGMVFPVLIFPRQKSKDISTVTVGNASFPVVVSTETTLNYGELVVAKALEIKADAIISLGIASDVRGLSIETRAINWVENAKYGLMCEQRKPIASNFLPKEYLRVNREKWHLQNFVTSVL